MMSFWGFHISDKADDGASLAYLHHLHCVQGCNTAPSCVQALRFLIRARRQWSVGIKERMVRPDGNICPNADFPMQIEEGIASFRPILQGDLWGFFY